MFHAINLVLVALAAVVALVGANPPTNSQEHKYHLALSGSSIGAASTPSYFTCEPSDAVPASTIVPKVTVSYSAGADAADLVKLELSQFKNNDLSWPPCYECPQPF